MLDLTLTKIAQERNPKLPEEIILRNRRAAQYSAEVARRKVEVRARLGALLVFIVLIAGCALCGV